jgi:hypothetical protein
MSEHKVLARAYIHLSWHDGRMDNALEDL